jgi:hypothetical protein
MGELETGDAGRRLLPRWPTFPVPVLAIIAFDAHNSTWAAAERSHSQGGERARQGGGGQPASHTCATLPATPSFFLPRPQSAKAAALHRGFEGHDPSKPSQSLRLGPCDSPPIGAQSALLAESRAKSSNNPSTPLSIKGKCLENCTPMTILQSQKPPSQASVLVATSKLTLGVRTQASKPPSTLLDERSDPVRMD